MAEGPALPAGFEKVRLGAGMASWVLFAAAVLLAGPHLYAVAFEYAPFEIDGTVVAGAVCAGLAVVARGVARSIARAQALRRSEFMAEAGVGEEFVVESRDRSTADYYRVVTAEKPPALPPLNRLADVVVERHGGDGLVIGVTVFVWLFLGVIILGIDGIFDGAPPSVGAIAGMAALTALAVTVGSLRYRKTLSNRDKALHTDLACLFWHRRRSWPLAGFDAVTVHHQIGRERVSSSSNTSSTRRVDEFKVSLRGAEEMQLETFRGAFRARRRAQQLAAYLGLPLAEPEVTDPDRVRLYQG